MLSDNYDVNQKFNFSQGYLTRLQLCMDSFMGFLVEIFFLLAYTIHRESSLSVPYSPRIGQRTYNLCCSILRGAGEGLEKQ